MGGDFPSFVSARLPFSIPESAVFYIQHLQEWTVPETAKVVIPFRLPPFLAMYIPSPGTNLSVVATSRS